MRRKINVQLISISIIAIISTMLVMLFVFYDLFQTQVQDDLSANAIVLKNTGIFHSGNEKGNTYGLPGTACDVDFIRWNGSL